MTELAEKFDLADGAALDAFDIRLARATVASCTCSTKTPTVRFHQEDCHYRVLLEAGMIIRQFREEYGALKDAVDDAAAEARFNDR